MPCNERNWQQALGFDYENFSNHLCVQFTVFENFHRNWENVEFLKRNEISTFQIWYVLKMITPLVSQTKISFEKFGNVFL